MYLRYNKFITNLFENFNRKAIGFGDTRTSLFKSLRSSRNSCSQSTPRFLNQIYTMHNATGDVSFLQQLISVTLKTGCNAALVESMLKHTYCAIYVEADLLYIERKTSALETFNTFLRLTSIASRHDVVCLSDICI